MRTSCSPTLAQTASPVARSCQGLPPMSMVATGETGRAEIGAVEFEGDIDPLTAAELRAPLRSQPGSSYGAGRVRDDAERLHAEPRQWKVRLPRCRPNDRDRSRHRRRTAHPRLRDRHRKPGNSGLPRRPRRDGRRRRTPARRVAASLQRADRGGDMRAAPRARATNARRSPRARSRTARGRSSRIRRVALNPSRSFMRRSINTMSGRCCFVS